MTGYLLDTNVVSAFAPGKAAVSPDTATWFEAQTERLFLSAVSVVEIEAGIAKLRHSGAVRRADDLTAWFGRLIGLYGGKVLTLDVPVARAAGALAGRARASGRDPGFADIAIAATAEVHGLTVLTRNGRHFAPLGVVVADPFDDRLLLGPASGD